MSALAHNTFHPPPYDPAFKLFGRTIPVSSVPDDVSTTRINPHHSCALSSYPPSSFQDDRNEAPLSEDESIGGSATDELGSSSGSNDGCDKEKPMGAPVGQLTTKEGNGGETQKGKKEDDEQGAGAAILKELKKPDKPVPCPRCDSLDTKFCYYNNYNVSQPRHFCKNCQRYWTAGGTLRNVPVGAGRRKSKNPAAHQRNMLADHHLRARDDPPDTAISCSGTASPVGLNRHLKIGASSSSRLHLTMDVCSIAALDSPSSSTILNFGKESPIRESIINMPSHLPGSEALQGQGKFSGSASLTGSSAVIDMDMDVKQNGLNNAREMNQEASASSEQKLACRSTGIVQSVEESLPAQAKMEPPEMPTNIDTSLGWAAGAPFTYLGGPWQQQQQYGGGSIGWNNAPPVTPTPTGFNPSSNSIPANPPQLLTLNHPHPLWCGPQASLWTGIPWPLMQGAVWGPPAWGAAWMMPWTPAAAGAAIAAPASSALGKRPLEQGESQIEKKGSLWVPKTLRIDDPEEAARSSIWTTLGLGNRPESMSSGGMFSAFQPKAEVMEVNARHSNPAAMTRSMAFQESNLGSEYKCTA